MCQQPVVDQKGNLIWCRKCEQCRRNRVNDWVGRCIAEDRHCTSSHSVTLTYGPDEYGNVDHVHSALLLYSDVQKFFKVLRRAGHKFKYLVAGEYGTKKHRAHWHVLFFWNGMAPSVRTHENYHLPEWPHGHTFWEDVTPNSISYVCKYLQNEEKDVTSETMLRMSKKPPIGHEWFQEFAKAHVDQGVSPMSFHYSFDGVRHKDGKRREFYMRGVSQDNFMRAYCNQYVKTNGHIKMPGSEALSKWLDKKYSRYFETEKWIREKQNGKITDGYKKAALLHGATAHGGIKIFLPSVSGRTEALALCADDTILEYGNPLTDPIAVFLACVNSDTATEFSITTVTGST